MAAAPTITAAAIITAGAGMEGDTTVTTAVFTAGDSQAQSLRAAIQDAAEAGCG
jgi:hypothetical protein